MSNYVLDGVIMFSFEDDRLAMHLSVAFHASAALRYADLLRVIMQVLVRAAECCRFQNVR